MVLLKQQYDKDFRITGDIEAISAELKNASKDKEMPSAEDKGVFVGQFFLEILWSDTNKLTIPPFDVEIKGSHLRSAFPVGVCFFKEQDEKLYAAIQSYVTAIVQCELNQLINPIWAEHNEDSDDSK